MSSGNRLISLWAPRPLAPPSAEVVPTFSRDLVHPYGLYFSYCQLSTSQELFLNWEVANAPGFSDPYLHPVFLDGLLGQLRPS